MNPPLRPWSDVEAVIEGLKDNTIEILATDHAPHASEKKMREIDQAPFGIVGLETLVPITVTSLIEPGHLTWPEVLRKLTCNPAQLLGIPKGTLDSRRRCGRDDHRPRSCLDDRPRSIPIQEPQYAVWRLEGSRPSPHGHRRGRGSLQPGRHRSASRRGRSRLNKTPYRSGFGLTISMPNHALADRRIQRDARRRPTGAEALARGVPPRPPALSG